MSQNDLDLIEEAYGMAPCEWMVVDAMIKKADTIEAKDRLKSISSHLFHKEEYDAGVL